MDTQSTIDFGGGVFDTGTPDTSVGFDNSSAFDSSSFGGGGDFGGGGAGGDWGGSGNDSSIDGGEDFSRNAATAQRTPSKTRRALRRCAFA